MSLKFTLVATSRSSEDVPSAAILLQLWKLISRPLGSGCATPLWFRPDTLSDRLNSLLSSSRLSATLRRFSRNDGVSCSAAEVRLSDARCGVVGTSSVMRLSSTAHLWNERTSPRWIVGGCDGLAP